MLVGAGLFVRSLQNVRGMRLGYDVGPLSFNNYEVASMFGPLEYPIVFLFGIVLFFATLHLARAVGKVHGLFAKHLLVKSAQYA